MDRLSASIILFSVGFVTLLTGLLYGFSSQTVTYQHTQQAPIAHFLSANGVGYMQMAGNSLLYIIREDDFRPLINENSFGDGDVISLTYDPSATTSIDVSSHMGTHLVGDASKVVEITLLTTNGLTTFVTPDYTQHQNGYSINRWPIAAAIILLSLLIAGLATYINTARKRNTSNVEIVNISQQSSSIATPIPSEDVQQERPLTPPDNTSVHQ